MQINESQLLSGSKKSYDTNFKVVMINHAEATNSCAAGRKFVVMEGNVCKWWQMKDKLRNVNSSHKAFGGPKKGHLHELDQCRVAYVHEKHNEGFPLT
jgi:hypothetical protein